MNIKWRAYVDDVGSQSVLLQASIVMGDDWQNVEVFFFCHDFYYFFDAYSPDNNMKSIFQSLYLKCKPY